MRKNNLSLFSKPENIILRLILLAGVFLFLTGLQPTYTIDSKKVLDPLKPTFCFDEKRNCTDQGVFLTIIAIMEYNDRGDIVQYNWILQHVKGNTTESAILNQLTYGVVPETYQEKYPAIKLKLNTYYSINHENFFKVYQSDGKYKIEIFNGILDGDAFDKAFPNSHLMALDRLRTKKKMRQVEKWMRRHHLLKSIRHKMKIGLKFSFLDYTSFLSESQLNLIASPLSPASSWLFP